jgi:dihydroneopterin aldolase
MTRARAVWREDTPRHKARTAFDDSAIVAATGDTMDIIFLHGLKIDCVIGIWDWERKIRQPVIIDLDMGFDIRRAAETDAIDDTLNYKAVTKRLQDFVGNSQFQLVETMAEQIAAILLGEFKLKWVRVRINKRGAVRGARDVGVIIERRSQQ